MYTRCPLFVRPHLFTLTSHPHLSHLDESSCRGDNKTPCKAVSTPGPCAPIMRGLYGSSSPSIQERDHVNIRLPEVVQRVCTKLATHPTAVGLTA